MESLEQLVKQNVSEELQAIEDVYLKVQGHYRHVQEVRAQYEEFADKNTALSSKLRQELSILRPEVEQLKAQHAERNRELNDMTNALKNLKVLEQKLPLEIDSKASKLNANAARLAVQVPDTAAQLRERQRKVDMLHNVVGIFASRSGMRLEQDIPGQLKFVFQYIDRRHPHKEFSFAVEVMNKDAATVYSVLSVEPRLDEDAVSRELHLVNQNTKEFGRFVKAMRKLFQASVTAT